MGCGSSTSTGPTTMRWTRPRTSAVASDVPRPPPSQFRTQIAEQFPVGGAAVSDDDIVALLGAIREFRRKLPLLLGKLVQARTSHRRIGMPVLYEPEQTGRLPIDVGQFGDQPVAHTVSVTLGPRQLW